MREANSSSSSGLPKWVSPNRPLRLNDAMHIPQPMLQACWFLIGPTACGKTEVGLLLAERLGAEIIAMDSMSLYRGMDVGTAKPSPEARRRVPHHLIDVLDPQQEFSLAEYVQAAGRACGEILDRGRVPLFVGGTGLYLRGLLRGVFDGPPADWEFRRGLEHEAKQHPPGSLHARLKEVDPVSAAQIHPHDTRRLVRALEVQHLTGRPLSEQQQQRPLPPDERPRHVYWLSPPRDWLYAQINRRVEQMSAAGLLEETRRLLARPEPLSRTARQALGYKEMIEHIESRATLKEAIDKIQRRTRQFAKRQHTWFRNLEECTAIEIAGTESVDAIVEKILDAAGESASRMRGGGSSVEESRRLK